MTKRTYIASFSDGHTQPRTSERDYTHAWRWTGTTASGLATEGTGFAASRELAQKALNSSASHTRNGWNPRHSRRRYPAGRIKFEEIVSVQPQT